MFLSKHFTLRYNKNATDYGPNKLPQCPINTLLLQAQELSFKSSQREYDEDGFIVPTYCKLRAVT